MSQVQTLRAFISQRLSAAAEEIIGQFERTIAEFEEELRQRRLLAAVFKPEVQLHSADVQLLLVSKDEEPPELQERGPSLDQEDQPELPHIKEEQEQLWTSQEEERLRGLEEADIIKFTFTPVKSEDDDEGTPQSSQLHQIQTEQMKIEANGDNCEGSEPARNSDPATHDKMLDSSEPETDNSSDWEETREPQSGLNLLQKHEAPVSDMKCNTGKTSVSSSKCATSFCHKGNLQEHNEIQTEVKPFSCSVCSKRYHWKDSLMTHMRLHLEGKHFSCSVCKKNVTCRGHVTHMRIHTGEKPFSCSVCNKRFSQKPSLTSHLRVHTGEKLFTCSVCNASFSLRYCLSQHMRLHTGEKPFSCSVCGKAFADRGTLRGHLTVHTREKPFSCSVCDKRFAQHHIFKKHKCVGERSKM